MEPITVRTHLEEVYEGGKPLKVVLTIDSRGIGIAFEGYSDYSTADDIGEPLFIENRYGVPTVVIWNDINQEDPTDTIRLSGAANSERER